MLHMITVFLFLKQKYTQGRKYCRGGNIVGPEIWPRLFLILTDFKTLNLKFFTTL
jgi:hypothetical protein